MANKSSIEWQKGNLLSSTHTVNHCVNSDYNNEGMEIVSYDSLQGIAIETMNAFLSSFERMN